MATLAATKTKIILQVDRDDMGTSAALEQALTDAIERSIEFYADEKFWFNQTSAPESTSADDATLTIDATIRTVERVSYNGELLTKVPLEQIQHRTETGQPTHWAENDGAIHLWPIPDAVYVLTQYGIAELGTPASGASNAWTTDALDLICASARKYLYRGYLRDPEGAALAESEVREVLTKLRRETARKRATPLRTDIPQMHSTFNINQGY